MQFLRTSVICLLSCLALLIPTACNDDDHTDKGIGLHASPHTLLIYMVGDNSLSRFCKNNVDSASVGLLNTIDTPLNLIVYEDNRDNTPCPQLYQLKLSDDRSRVDTLIIEQYEEELNSADPKVMTQIIKTVFDIFDTPIKGLVLWSHGMAWIPSKEFISAQTTGKPITRGATYFGEDNEQHMELWELREALEKGPYFNYIISDACHMSTIEVLYELRHTTDYLLASPTEIMGEGFPYTQIIPILSACTSTGQDSLRITLTQVADAYATMYADNGTISLLQTNGIESFAQTYKTFLSDNRDKLVTLQASPEQEIQIQHFGRKITGARYYFYDIVDFARYLNPDDLRVATGLANNIRSTFFSPTFDEGREELVIEQSCGLAVSIPEVFGLVKPLYKNGKMIQPDSTMLRQALPLTAWGKFVYGEE